ncbi:MAG: alpha-glucuronidase, partial [Daejeonella sp.]|nr:alpha-glucuronidase [Daejeonella sp.]
AAKQELNTGLKGLLSGSVTYTNALKNGTLIIGTPKSSPLVARLNLNQKLSVIGEEGFLILTTGTSNNKHTIIAANTDQGILYGVFNFLQLLQTHKNISNLNISSAPKLKLRVLNHWDNLDRTVERGYAGFSLWNWHKLPDYLDPRYTDYARANASIGINGTVLTNVNANALFLTEEYLLKSKALAAVFRPYGIKVYFTARFSAPIEIGGLSTADPLDPKVQQWWKNKADEIYKHIPDFGGFLVKANSEGQPGPQNYGRNHADGANMLADAVASHGGVVMWRAFVYDNKVPDDRSKQAYNEFTPLDGTFRKNVLVQVKNGPIDFQPREPFHPLFGKMPKTPLMMEFQITQEYLGFSTHLVYLGSLFKECLNSDTYAKGKGSTVAKIIDGSIDNHSLSGMAGVANIGNDRNWTGHIFGQANWFAFGKLAWNHELTEEQIADDWIRMTFSNDPASINPIKNMMLSSREAAVNYMTPLGLHHLMGYSHHFGPGPWVANKERADWTAVYYHKADSAGIGFNRTKTGSKAISQYFPEVQKQFEDLNTISEKDILWFHHVSWAHKMKSGKTLWDELCHKYYEGVDSVQSMRKTWEGQKEKVDPERFIQVQTLLKIQEKEATVWRNSCVLYFQTFSKMPIPIGLEKPEQSLEYYKKLKYSFVPGN